MGKTKKKTREDKLCLKREKERKRYQKIKLDPEAYEKQKEKERLKYLRKKEQGQIKPAALMSKRDLRAKRNRQKINSKNYRLKLAQYKKTCEFLSENSPPQSITSDVEEAEVPIANAPIPSCSGFQSKSLNDPHPVAKETCSKLYSDPYKSKKCSGRQRIRRDRTKMYKELQKYKSALKKAENKGQRYKKRYERLKKRVSHNNSEHSPRTEVKNLLGNETVSPKIRKRLLFAEVIEKQLKQNYCKLKSDRSKQIFSKAVGGKILKKYRMIHASKSFLQYKRFIANNKRGSELVYHRKKRVDSIPPGVKLDIINFLEEDVNSRVCPGKRDCVTQKKVTKQKRLLNDTMENLYCKYLASHTHKMHYSTFCKLRPFWIQIPKVNDRDTSKCITHTNMELLVTAMYANKLILQKTPTEVKEAILCNKYNESCLQRLCSNCKQKSILYLEQNNNNVSYWKWIKKNEFYTDPKTGQQKKIQKTVKEEIVTTLSALRNIFQENLFPYLAHERKVIHQHQTIKELKQNLKNDEVIIHMDFSENYVCKYSEEPQSVHFGGSRQQVTLHTVVIYFKEESELMCRCFSTFSDSLRHSAAAVWAHLHPIFQQISQLPKICVVHFISDGPSGQYRNKTMFYFFSKVTEELPSVTTSTWNYSESGHGKGAPDGVGGVIKRTADRIVAQGQDIPDLNHLLAELKTRCKGIDLAVISEDAIVKQQQRLLGQNLKCFVGTLKVHQVCWAKDNPTRLLFRKLSCFKCSPEKTSCKHKLGELIFDKILQEREITSKLKSTSPTYDKMQDQQLKISDWVAVQYDGKLYPGEVTEIVSATEVKVSAMTSAGRNCFKWPSKPDVLTYQMSDILKNISHPVPCGNRAITFIFHDF